MAQQYTNIRIVLDRVMRHPLLRDMTLETAVDYCVDFIREMGVPDIYFDKTEEIDFEDYRAQLPCDFIDVIQVRNIDHNNPVNNVCYRAATDTFHVSRNRTDFDDLTYKIQGGYIITSKEKGTLEISYRAILTDRDGFPLIPDNPDFLRALELYIKKQWFTILFDLNRISSNVLQNAQQDYAWAAGCCESEFRRLSIDQAEAFFNSFRTLVMREYEHRNGFVDNGTKERLKIN